MQKLLALLNGELTEVLVATSGFSWRKIPNGLRVAVPVGNQMTVYFGLEIGDGAELVTEQDGEVLLL